MSVYYAYKSKDGHVYCVREALSDSLMTGDLLLFDTAEACVEYWENEGIAIDRFAI